MKKKLVVIANNIRSALNVGSIFRICDASGVTKLYLTGYTPFPRVANDKRLCFEIEKTEQKIKKAGLEGFNISFEHIENIFILIQKFKEDKYKIIALEQNKNSTSIYDYKVEQNTAIIIGNEVTGIKKDVLNICDDTIEIPMYGKGKSLNVAISLAIMLYITKGQTYGPACACLRSQAVRV